ncbi:MAG: DUF3298 domain-containing protein [Patescibacteria group bacterium]
MCLRKSLDYKTIKIIAILLAVLFLLGWLGYWLGIGRSTDSGGQKLSYENKVITEEFNEPAYQIKVDYPFFTGPADNLNHLNDLIYQTVTKQVSNFKNELSDWPSSESSQDFYASSLNTDYDLIQADTVLVSLRFNMSSYLAGAAHPSSFSETFNYSVRDGSLINLSDLFEPAADYLTVLSAYAIDDLASQPDLKNGDGLALSLIEQGAAVNKDNFSKFTIKPQGLEFYFDPYQVAPYAAGLRVVVIPWVYLKDIISADFNYLWD